MKKYYKFAGVDLEITIPDQWMYREERHLAPFLCDGANNPHRFFFDLTQKLTPPAGMQIASFPGFRVFEESSSQIRYIGSVDSCWENAYLRVEHRGRDHIVQLKANASMRCIGVQTVLNALAVEHLVLDANGVILHASFVEHKGSAILFTAPSQTGKSTQAELWQTLRGAQIINGDRAVIRMVDGQPVAAGLPFAGSSQYCKNRTVPLAAVVHLGQAPCTTIRRLSAMEGFRKIWEGCSVNTWDRKDMDRALDIVQSVASRVPVYEMKCTPDQTAVLALEHALEGE